MADNDNQATVTDDQQQAGAVVENQSADNGNQQAVADPAATIAGTAATSDAQQADKPTDKQDKGENNAAVTYDFKDVVPENFEFSAEEQGKFVEVIKDMNLSNEQASAIAKYGMEWAQGIVNGIAEQIVTERKGWADTARQELGADFDNTVKLCGTAIEHIEKTVPGIRQALNETGAGNRIEIIRAFSLLGNMISGDPGMAQKDGTATADGVKSEYAARYPNTDFRKYY